MQTNLKFKFAFKRNYPNPFTSITTINLEIPERSFVSLNVFDILGNEVASLVNEQVGAGIYANQFSIIADQLPSGIYFYRLNALSIANPARNYIQTRKMILTK